jgi:hypothetical protein
LRGSVVYDCTGSPNEKQGSSVLALINPCHRECLREGSSSRKCLPN